MIDGIQIAPIQLCQFLQSIGVFSIAGVTNVALAD